MNWRSFFQCRVAGDFWQDILYALRAMRKNPTFAAAAALTLSLGIGGNTAIFTMIRSVLLRPLDYPDPDRLVYFRWTARGGMRATVPLPCCNSRR
jgi:hypothetical protein